MLGFLDLPPELRLKVYHHVITASIADGNAGSAGALLHTCRAVCGELRADYIPAVATILEAIGTWKSVYPHAPLKIDLPRDYDFRQAPAHATINFPIRLVENRGPIFVNAIANLQLLLSEPWSSLTFSMYMSETCHNQATRPGRFYWAFRNIFSVMEQNIYTKNAGQRAYCFPRTRRLMLCFKARMLPDMTETMSQVYDSKLNEILSPSVSESQGRWVSKGDDQGQEVWTFGFDLDVERE